MYMNHEPGLDAIAAFNRQRWEELVEAGVLYSRPLLNLDETTAHNVVDPYSLLGDLQGKDVLCLAAGGGQQSAAFGLLGANVTVLDITAGQLEKDRLVARHYGLDLTTIQGDMRDLSVFAEDAFDVVWHAYSITFIPDARPVFAEVARVIRPGGIYRIQWGNPFLAGVDDREWDGRSYPLKDPYLDGVEVQFADEHWDVEQPDGTVKHVVGPKEFRHILSGVVNTLVGHGFIILGLWEETSADPDPEPGSWDHYKLIAPPWLQIWAAYRPDVLNAVGTDRSINTS